MSSDPADYESPRQRRERIFVRRRSRRRYVLVAAVVLLFAFAGGIWAFYRLKSGPAVSAEVPLIRADEQPTRKRPSDAGGMTVPERDSIVLNRAEPSVEQLLPPPETPLPRPATPEPPAGAEPTPPPQAAGPPQGQQAEPPNAASAAPTSAPPTAAAAPSSVAAAPPRATAAPPSATPPAQERKTARAAAPPAPMPANGKGYRLQLGSVRTPEAAKKEWDHLKGEQGDLLGALGFTAERADLGARGIYYRIQAGPIADAATAERNCSELKRRGIGCILVKP